MFVMFCVIYLIIQMSIHSLDQYRAGVVVLIVNIKKKKTVSVLSSICQNVASRHQAGLAEQVRWQRCWQCERSPPACPVD